MSMQEKPSMELEENTFNDISESCLQDIKNLISLLPKAFESLNVDLLLLKDDLTENTRNTINAFYDLYMKSKDTIVKYWEQIHGQFQKDEPFCSTEDHASNPNKICKYRQAIRKLFETDLPRVRSTFITDKLRDCKKWHKEAVTNFWPFFLDGILHDISRLMERNDTPEGVLEIVSIWERTGRVIQVLWYYGRKQAWFTMKPANKCGYKTWHRDLDEAIKQQDAHSTNNDNINNSDKVYDSHKKQKESLGADIANYKFEDNNDATKERGSDPYNQELELKIDQLTDEHIREQTRLSNDNKQLQEIIQDWKKKYRNLEQENKKNQDDLSLVKQQKQKLVEEMDKLLIRKAETERRDRPHTAHGTKGFSDGKMRLLLDKQGARIEELLSENTKLRESRERVLNSISAQMNKEMSRDESDLENISSINRPMKILEEYMLFCSDEWLEAKTTLDDWAESSHAQRDDRDLCTILVTAMQNCYDEMKKVYENTKEKLAVAVDLAVYEIESFRREMISQKEETGGSERSEATRDTTKSGSHGGIKQKQKVKQERSSLDKDIEVALAKCLKSTCNKVDFKTASEVMSASVFGEIDGNLQKNKALQQYTSKCLSLSWKMLLQQPPMRFVCDAELGIKFIDKKHEPHFGSANPANPNASISYCVHPMLMHGDRQMSKARVFLSTTKN